MIVELEKQTVQSNTNADEQKFAPTEQGLLHLIDVVANKQYKNPIKSLMVEYVQNALDSHDEETARAKKNGKEIELPPVEITIPSEDHLFYEVRDFGISMSNKEVVSILTKIGLSTKNHTQDLRGGFGLGKLVFSAYNTRTMLISNYYNGERHDWVARLGGGEGGITPLGKVKSKERQGLHIKIPVRKEDIHTFREYSQELYSYITPEPKILNYKDHAFDRDEIVKEGKDWLIVNSRYTFIATMGGLAFPIESSYIDHPVVKSGINNYQNREGLVLHFKVGELDIVSSRDSLDYGPEKKTLSAIKKRLDEIQKVFCEEHKKFNSLNKFEQKETIRKLMKIRQSTGLLSVLEGSFYNSDDVQDWLKAYNRHLIMGNDVHYSKRDYYFNLTNISWKRNNREYSFGFYKEVERVDLFADKIYTYVHKKLSPTRLRNIMNKTASGKDSWHSGQTNTWVLIARSQKELDDFLERHIISKDVIVNVNDFEKEYSELSKDSSSASTPHKVYLLQSNYSISEYSPASSFTCIDFSDEKYEDTDNYIWASFYRYSVNRKGDGYNLLHLVQTAKKMGIINEAPRVLCFNKIAQKKYKPEETYTHMNEYAEELKKKISEKIDERISDAYELCVNTAYGNHLDFRLKNRFRNVSEDDIRDTNLRYIVSTHKEVSNESSGKYEGLHQHEKFETIRKYAEEYVINVLTKLKLIDYNSLIDNLIERELKNTVIK
jgi:hypothetical protein